MKFLMILIMTFISSNAFAGMRHIHCHGNVVQMDILAKGPKPIYDEITVKGLEKDIVLKKINFEEDNDSQDFQIIYQSISPGIDILAYLRYVDGNFSLLVTNKRQIVEGVPCQLGF